MKFFRFFEIYLNFAIARKTIIKVKPLTNPKKPKANDFKLSNSVELRPLTASNLLPFFSLGYGFAFTLIFLLYEAKTFQEFSETLYPVVTTLLNIGNLTVLMSNGKRIFELIDRFGDVVENRKPITLFN